MMYTYDAMMYSIMKAYKVHFFVNKTKQQSKQHHKD